MKKTISILLVLSMLLCSTSLLISCDKEEQAPQNEQTSQSEQESQSEQILQCENNGHSYGEWYTSVDPTCTAEGKKRHDCENCSHYEEQTIASGGHDYESKVIAACISTGFTKYTCTVCGDTYKESYVSVNGKHVYDDGECTGCDRNKIGTDWLVPDFADGDYTIAVLPDTQNLITHHPDVYYDQMRWIANNKESLNIQAVLHMGDMVNNNTTTEWSICKAGMNIIEQADIPFMPMRGNHDSSDLFNQYFGYYTYGINQSWFGGSYHQNKLDHTYWYVTVGEREYMILSLGWAPSWDVLEWAQDVVEANSDKNVILTCHAYMNKDGSLLAQGDSMSATGAPSGEEVWNALKQYDNVVLAMGGHVHSPDIVTWVGKNGANKNVTSMLIDRQDDDINNSYAMIALLTFHSDSDRVDVNWYSVRYDALYKSKNQFSINVPHID